MTDLHAGIDGKGRAAILIDLAGGRSVVAGCTARHRCHLSGPLPWGTLAVAPSGRTYFLSAAGAAMTLRIAARPTARFGRPRTLDAGHKLSHVVPPVLYATPQGRMYVAWRRAGGALMIAPGTGTPRRLAGNGRPAVLTGDSKGNLLLVWTRGGRDTDSALVTRLAADGTPVGPARLVTDQLDESFLDVGDAHGALLDSGRVIASATSTEYDGDYGYETTYVATSPRPGAGLVTTTPDVDDPAIVPAGDDDALFVWDHDGVTTALFDGGTLQPPTVLTHTPGEGPLGARNVAGAGGATLIAGAREGGVQVIDLPDQPITLAGTSTTRGRKYVHDAVPALAPGGTAAMVVFTVNVEYPEDRDPQPSDAVRVSFR